MECPSWDELRVRRFALKLKQKDVAKRLNVPVNTLSRLENELPVVISATREKALRVAYARLLEEYEKSRVGRSRSVAEDEEERQ